MKYALLIGINYTGTDSALNGCINDVLKMKETLITHFGFTENNITILTDETAIKPTGQNIINSITNIILKTFIHSDSQLWIHYSGHGASIQDDNSDEADGMDEVIVPLDYQTKGIITDDTLHGLFKHIPSKTHCICFFDCCHSGTILDLKYKYNEECTESVDNSKSLIHGNVFMISGCKDDQTSADYFNNSIFQWCGAMTTSFISVLEKNNYEINCGELLKQLRVELVANNFTQQPQMTSSYHLTKSSIFCSKTKTCLIKSK